MQKYLFKLKEFTETSRYNGARLVLFSQLADEMLRLESVVRQTNTVCELHRGGFGVVGRTG